MSISPARISNRLVAYGAFLVVSGIIGYVLTNEESASSIVNGIVSGILMIVLALIYRSGRPWTLPAALSATAIFSLTFLWRGIVQWLNVIYGNNGQPAVAMLLTLMFIISVLMGYQLLSLQTGRSRMHRRSSHQ